MLRTNAGWVHRTTLERVRDDAIPVLVDIISHNGYSHAALADALLCIRRESGDPVLIVTGGTADPERVLCLAGIAGTRAIDSFSVSMAGSEIAASVSCTVAALYWAFEEGLPTSPRGFFDRLPLTQWITRAQHCCIADLAARSRDTSGCVALLDELRGLVRERPLSVTHEMLGRLTGEAYSEELFRWCVERLTR